MFERAQIKELRQRIFEPRNRIQVISGPRQVGKSTMVKQALQDITVPYMYVSADNVDHTDTTSNIPTGSARPTPTPPTRRWSHGAKNIWLRVHG